MKGKITLIQILFLFVFAVSAFFAVRTYFDRNKTEKDFKELQSMVAEPEPEGEEETESVEPREPNGMLSRYYALYERNNDMAGWIKIDGTNIDYPVMYNSDSNAYYLHRDFDGNNSSAGIPFMDYQCEPTGGNNNVIIYAHNMKNGAMFHSLLQYGDLDYERSNPYIRFDTMYNRGIYEIFAVFRTEVGAEDEFKYYEFINAESREEYEAFIDNCLSHSLYDTGIPPEYGEELITLSTCSYNANNERFVVVARLIEKK